MMLFRQLSTVSLCTFSSVLHVYLPSYRCILLIFCDLLAALDDVVITKRSKDTVVSCLKSAI